MTYAADEQSIAAGEPVELYEFIGPQVTYRYTSGLVAREYNGGLFAPLAISRGNAGVTPTTDPASLVITMPVSAEVVAQNGFGNPTRSMQLRLYRVQERSDEVREIWRGKVAGVTPKGRMAQVRVSSKIGDTLATSVPSISYQAICNHFLYDNRCRVDRTTYDFDALISAVSASGKQVTLNSIGIAPDEWFRAGELVRNADGERRLIVGQVGAVLQLSAPFRMLSNGDSVTLYAGCDHTVITCSDKFNNVVNFGGHPSIPRSNPFLINIRLARKFT